MIQSLSLLLLYRPGKDSIDRQYFIHVMQCLSQNKNIYFQFNEPIFIQKYSECTLSVRIIFDTVFDMLLSILKHKVNTFFFEIEFSEFKCEILGSSFSSHFCTVVKVLVSICFESEFLKSPFAVNSNRLFDCQYRQRHNSNIFECQDKESRLWFKFSRLLKVVTMVLVIFEYEMIEIMTDGQSYTNVNHVIRLFSI